MLSRKQEDKINQIKRKRTFLSRDSPAWSQVSADGSVKLFEPCAPLT